MKSRLQELNDYVFGDLANIDKLINEMKVKDEKSRQALEDAKKSGKTIAQKKLKNSKEELKSQPRQIKTLEEKQQFIKQEITKKVNSYFKNIISENNKERFRQALRLVKAKPYIEEILYRDAKDTKETKITSPGLFSEPVFDEKAVVAAFEKLELKYQFFSDSKDEKSASPKKIAAEKYVEFYKIFKLISIVENSTEQDIMNQAYKMLILFGDIKHFDDYIIKHPTLLREDRPIHNALIWDLPVNNPSTPIHLAKWQELIRSPKGGHKVVRFLFNRAVEIESALKGVPKSFEEGIKIAKSLVYKNADKDPLLADICMEHNVNQDIFETCLALNKQRKKSDNLPVVEIDGENGYFIVKLPIDDPRAYLLGHITNCCQSIGGHSEQCVRDGVTLQNNGFYVLLKQHSEKKSERKSDAKDDKKIDSKDTKDEKKAETVIKPLIQGKINYEHFDIVGQGYAWLSQGQNLVIDSWENLRNELEDKEGKSLDLRDDAIITPMLHKFGKAVAEIKDTPIVRILIGTGGKTPEALAESPITHIPETMLEGKQYGDSTNQVVIFTNVELQSQLAKEIQKNFISNLQDEKTATEFAKQLFPIDMIYSTKQAHAFNTFLSSLLKNDKMKHYLNQMHLDMLSVTKTEEKGEFKKPSLIQANKYSTGIIWNAFHELIQAKLMNQQNIDALVTIYASIPANLLSCQTWISLLAQLHEAKLNNTSNIKNIINHFSRLEVYAINHILDCLTKAKSAGWLNQQFFEGILKARFYGNDLLLATALLEKANLFNKDSIDDPNIQVIIQKPIYAEEMAKILINLHSIGILTNQTRQIIIDHQDDSIHIDIILIHLHNAKLLNEQNCHEVSEFISSYYVGDLDDLPPLTLSIAPAQNHEEIARESKIMKAKAIEEQTILTQAWITLKKADLLNDKNNDIIFKLVKDDPEKAKILLDNLAKTTDKWSAQKILDSVSISRTAGAHSLGKFSLNTEEKRDQKEAKDHKDEKKPGDEQEIKPIVL